MVQFLGGHTIGLKQLDHPVECQSKRERWRFDAACRRKEIVPLPFISAEGVDM